MPTLKIVGGFVTAFEHSAQLRFELEDGSFAMVECEIEAAPAPEPEPTPVEKITQPPTGEDSTQGLDQTDSSGDVQVPEA